MSIDTLWHILVPVKVGLGTRGVLGNLPLPHGLLEYGVQATIKAEQNYVTYSFVNNEFIIKCAILIESHICLLYNGISYL